jgi:hypothetical protein
MRERMLLVVAVLRGQHSKKDEGAEAALPSVMFEVVVELAKRQIQRHPWTRRHGVQRAAAARSAWATEEDATMNAPPKFARAAHLPESSGGELHGRIEER